jgi:UvrD-like helicase C-terminal domain
VRYVLVSGVPFWSRKEVKDVLAYLRLVSGLSDDVALCRIINVPVRGFGTRTMEKLRGWAAAQGAPLASLLFQGCEVTRLPAGNGGCSPGLDAPKPAWSQCKGGCVGWRGAVSRAAMQTVCGWRLLPHRLFMGSCCVAGLGLGFRVGTLSCDRDSPSLEAQSREGWDLRELSLPIGSVGRVVAPRVPSWGTQGLRLWGLGFWVWGILMPRAPLPESLQEWDGEGELSGLPPAAEMGGVTSKAHGMLADFRRAILEMRAQARQLPMEELIKHILDKVRLPADHVEAPQASIRFCGGHCSCGQRRRL